MANTRFMTIKKGFLFACFIALIGSFGNALQGTFIKYYTANLHIGLYDVILIRCIASIIILLPFSFKQMVSFIKSKNLIKNVLIILLLAILYSADIILYNTGLKTTPVNTGTLIMLLVPLWMCFFGKIILHENDFNKITAFSLLACIFAVVYTTIGDLKFGNTGVGVIFIFANSIVLPIGVILQKKFADFRPIAFALFTNSIVLGLVVFFLSGCHTNILLSTFNPFDKSFNLEFLICAVLIAIFDIMESGGVYLSCKLANVSSLQPIRFTRIIFAIIVSGIVLGEIITAKQAISTIIILMANTVSIVFSHKKYLNK